MEEDYYGFSVPYRGKLKMFRAQASKLKELKKLLDAKILFGDMNSFYKSIQEIGNGAYSKVLFQSKYIRCPWYRISRPNN